MQCGVKKERVMEQISDKVFRVSVGLEELLGLLG